LSHEKVFGWFHCFKDGHTSTESDKHSGNPSSSRNDEVIANMHDLVRADQRITIREVAEKQGIFFCSSKGMLTKGLGREVHPSAANSRA
jgi:hypothetical protein